MLEIFTKNEAIWFLYILINYSFVLLAYRLWGKIGAMIFVPISIIIANIQVTKLVVLFGLETTLGNIAYSTIFIVSDIISENYGKKEAKKIVGLGFITLIFTTLVMNIALAITPSSYDSAQVHLKAIFTPLIRLTIASLTAYVVSSTADILLYQLIKKIKPDFKDIWLRNNVSTLISQILDNVVFNFMAFLGVLDLKIIISIILSTYILKIITSLFDTPFVYLAAYWKKKGEIKEL